MERNQDISVEKKVKLENKRKRKTKQKSKIQMGQEESEDWGGEEEKKNRAEGMEMKKGGREGGHGEAW